MIKWAFFIGSIGYICCLRVAGMWMMPYISPAQNPNLFFNDITLIGTAFALSQFINAIADPILGKYISTIRRRFLFQLFSVVTFSLTSLIPFNPIYTFSNDWINMFILLILLIINLLFCSFYQTCFLALIPVLSRDDHERSQNSTFVTYGMIVGGALALGMSGFVVEAVGLRTTIIIFVFVGLFFMLLSSFMVPFDQVKPMEKKTDSFSKDMLIIFQNSYFITAIIAILAANNVYTYFTFIAPYITEVIVKQSHNFTSYAVGISVLLAVVSTPLASKNIKRFGSLNAMLITLMIFTLSLILIGMLGVFSNLKILLTLYLAGCIVCGIGIGQSLVISYVLIAESVNREPKGKETAPIYHSFYNLFLKIATGLVTFLMSYLFETFGSSLTDSMGIKLSFLIPLIGILIAAVYLLAKKNSYHSST